MKYLSAYEPGSVELLKDKLKSWEIIKTEDQWMEVQLTFVDPLYVATADGLSKIIINFGDG